MLENDQGCGLCGGPSGNCSCSPEATTEGTMGSDAAPEPRAMICGWKCAGMARGRCDCDRVLDTHDDHCPARFTSHCAGCADLAPGDRLRHAAWALDMIRDELAAGRQTVLPHDCDWTHRLDAMDRLAEEGLAASPRGDGLDELTARLREQHRGVDPFQPMRPTGIRIPYCNACDEPWPCLVIRVLDRLAPAPTGTR